MSDGWRRRGERKLINAVKRSSTWRHVASQAQLLPLLHSIITITQLSSMPLVSGYDSDSGSDNGEASSAAPVAVPSSSKPAGGLASFLPAPKAASSSAASSATAPSAQAAAGKKKRQITIESLSSLGRSTEPAAKRAKLAEGQLSGPPKLGLFGMLPAPKVVPAPTTKSDQQADSTASASRTAGSSAAEKAGGDASFVGVKLAAPTSEDEDEEPGQTAKAKGNDAFRAMLGLAPSNKPKPKPKPQSPAQLPSAQTSAAAKSSGTSQVKTAATAPRPAALEDDFEEQGGFFGLAPQPSASSSTSTPSASSFTPARTKFSISAAPTHDADEEEAAESYPGWSQDPDGSWVPLTPAAHAQYAAWQEEQRRDAARKKPERDAAAAELARAGIDVATLRSVDAAADAQATYDAQPPALSDARYAAAAAAVGSAASVEEAGGEEGKKMDKKTGFKARQKGQLSALVAQAEENRERLEQRWASGKSARAKSSQKYGF